MAQIYWKVGWNELLKYFKGLYTPVIYKCLEHVLTGCTAILVAMCTYTSTQIFQFLSDALFSFTRTWYLEKRSTDTTMTLAAHLHTG